MANLPDINTANVGIIAFWNAEDHKTAGVVDPTDCTGVFTNYSVYDNGLDGDISLGSGRLFNCRVKNDGWCVAWIDRTNTFFYPNKLVSDFGESGYKGYYDILWDWISYNAGISATLTTLSYILSLLEAALETSGDFTFAAGDVGHYCYEFTSANVMTLLSVFVNGAAQTGNVQHTTGTSIYYAAVTAAEYQYHGGAPLAYFAGNHIIDSVPMNFARYGTADIKAENWMPNPLTDYALYIYNPDLSGDFGLGSILILWS